MIGLYLKTKENDDDVTAGALLAILNILSLLRYPQLQFELLVYLI